MGRAGARLLGGGVGVRARQTFAVIAQLAELSLGMGKVGGSMPSGGSI
jgi:hypothetical protein